MDEMKLILRWHGEKDPISLRQYAQIPNLYGIVTSLYHLPLGQVWDRAEVLHLKEQIEAHGLRFEVVDSFRIHEDIKRGLPSRDALIERYQANIRMLAECGIKIICYNFMPVLDWARTDLEYPNPDGTSNLYFNRAEFAYFDVRILKRPGAADQWDALTIERMNRLAETMTPEKEAKLVENIVIKTQGFVSGNFSEGDANPVEKFRSLLKLYDGIDKDTLRENMKYFLEAVMPVCNEYGINMCVHPDDPPMPVFGLPRIVTCDEDIEWFLNAVPDEHNGLTFCAGSLSAGAHNDVVKLAKKYASRTHFVHARICTVMPGGDFRESSHLDPRLIDVIRTFETVRPDVPMRVDHAPLMLGDEKMGYNAGYSFHGRMLALGMVSGIMATVHTEKV